MTAGETKATGQIGPYPSTGRELQSTTKGPTTRVTAKGKREHIEANVKDIKFDNYQFIVETTLGKVEKDGTIGLSVGGTHMSSGWFVTGVSFEQGECCSGTDP